MAAHPTELGPSSYAIVATERALFPAAIALQGMLAHNRLNSHLLPENTATQQLDQPAINRLRDTGAQALIIVEPADELSSPYGDSTYTLQKLGQNYPEGIRTVTVDNPASFNPRPYVHTIPSCEGLTLVAPEPELVDPVLASMLASQIMIMTVQS